MRLAFVIQEAGKSPGGVVAVVKELCRGWGAGDHITLLMNRNHPARALFAGLRRTCDAMDTACVPFPLPSDRPVKRIVAKIFLRPLRWLQMGVVLGYLTAWLRRHRIEGVVSHNGGWPGGELNRLVIYAAWLAGIPRRFLVIHNTPWQPPFISRGVYRMYGRMVGRLATKVVSVSHDCRGALREVAGFDAVAVIYNGISRGKEGEEAARRLVRPPWEKRYTSIGFIGEMRPRKGVHILVEALKDVKPPCELVLVGDGDDAYKAQIHQAAAAVPHPVHLLGFRGDVQEIYPWLDIVVLPSIGYESFGMVIVEAMRAGIAVICSDFGGMKEVVVDGETGLIVRAGDARALAAAIERLLGDQALRRRMGSAGRARVAANFSAEVMVKCYLELVHSGLTRRPVSMGATGG